MKGLSEVELTRYQRNILIPELGIAGQEKIRNGRVLVVGAGGLGSPALFYLACAGVGTLGIVDGDRVELSNLQRQILHTSSDIHRPKTQSASDTLRALNPHITIVAHSRRFDSENGSELVRGYDFVIEATDNFESKFLVNDACVRNGVPYSHAGVLGLIGQAMTVVPGRGPCFRCIFGKPPEPHRVPTTSQVGVLGVVPGVMGCIQASEALKYLTGIGDLLIGRLLTYDALTSRFREVPLPDSCCPLCRSATETL